MSPTISVDDPSYAGDGLYREHILDHFKNPRQHGVLEQASFTHRELNTSCGDEVTLSVQEKTQVVDVCKFTGHGCAISQAATSMLMEILPGKSFKDVMSMQRDDMQELVGIPVGPARTKCLMLGLVAIKNGIALYQAQREYG